MDCRCRLEFVKPSTGLLVYINLDFAETLLLPHSKITVALLTSFMLPSVFRHWRSWGTDSLALFTMNTIRGVQDSLVYQETLNLVLPTPEIASSFPLEVLNHFKERNFHNRSQGRDQGGGEKESNGQGESRRKTVSQADVLPGS